MVADTEPMTAHSSPLPDWKVTTGYRVLIKVGWGVTALAVYLAAAATFLGAVGIWWIVAGLATAALLVGLLLPEPVPREMIIGPANRIDPVGRR
ncbi:MAG: hypothetical protein A2Z12_06355 [Actinobacteria bacterium RBG_16_68_21]|nr:MAG: hypothetical protein A2Z12_06355 [Actinobacteria bacterium RBG_16_68_21]